MKTDVGQTFVLDRRSHTADSLSDKLARAQGPAFLAHNNAKFNADNWHSIHAIYESSKLSDSAYVSNSYSLPVLTLKHSKIGKYGVGFRSVFHVRIICLRSGAIFIWHSTDHRLPSDCLWGYICHV